MAHAARLLITVQGKCVSGELIAPKRLFEPLLQHVGAGGVIDGELGQIEEMPDRRQPPGGIGISLDFAKGNRRLSQRTVGVEHGIDGVLPALCNQARWGPAKVVAEPIAVGVGEVFDPCQSTNNVRPKRLDERAIAGAAVIRTGEHYKQRSCIDRSVVLAEWDFAERGHFAVPDFVHNFSWFGVLVRVELLRLSGCQKREYAARNFAD